MSRHLADHRKTTTGSRTRAFMRLARAPREFWHRPRVEAGGSRIKQFLRIARGHTA